MTHTMHQTLKKIYTKIKNKDYEGVKKAKEELVAVWKEESGVDLHILQEQIVKLDKEINLLVGHMDDLLKNAETSGDEKKIMVRDAQTCNLKIHDCNKDLKDVVFTIREIVRNDLY